MSKRKASVKLTWNGDGSISWEIKTSEEKETTDKVLASAANAIENERRRPRIAALAWKGD